MGYNCTKINYICKHLRTSSGINYRVLKMILEKSPPPFTILQWWVSRWKLRKHSERELKSAFIKLLLSLDFTFYKNSWKNVTSIWFRRFREGMKDMIGYYPSYFFVACWSVFTPAICAGIFLFKVRSLLKKIVFEKDRFF